MSPPPILLLVSLNFRPSYSTTLIFIIVAVVGVQEVNIHTYFMPEHKVLQPCTSVHTAYTDTSYEVLKSKNAKKKSCQIVLFSCNFEPFCFLIDCVLLRREHMPSNWNYHLLNAKIQCFQFVKTRSYSWCQPGLAWNVLVKRTLFS